MVLCRSQKALDTHATSAHLSESHCSMHVSFPFIVVAGSEEDKSARLRETVASIIPDCHICLELSIKVFKLAFEVYSRRCNQCIDAPTSCKLQYSVEAISWLN